MIIRRYKYTKKIITKNYNIIIKLHGDIINQLFILSLGYSLSLKYIKKLQIIDNLIFNNFNENIEEKDLNYDIILTQNTIENASLNNNIYIDKVILKPELIMNYSNNLIDKLLLCITPDKNNNSYFIYYDRNLSDFYSIALNYIEDASVYVINDYDDAINGNDIIKINITNELDILRIMISCNKGGICGRNFISWWGIYLNKNPNKKIIIPEIWLGDEFTFNNSIIINNNKQYFLTIGAMFKNESHILKEWIEHYLYHGFEHIYLINDNSTDDYLSILEPYINDNIITLYQNDVIYNKLGRQEIIYNKYLLEESKKSEWFFIADLDEFLYSPKIIDIKKIIINYHNYSELKIRWIIFGSNNLIYQPNSVIKSFSKRSTILKNVNGIKSIVKTSNLTEFRIHKHNIIGESINIVTDELIINHYNVQSLEFYTQIKMTRGDSNNYIQRNLAIFNRYNLNDITDNRLYEQNKDLINNIDTDNRITIVSNGDNNLEIIKTMIENDDNYKQCLVYNYKKLNKEELNYNSKIKFIKEENINLYISKNSIIEYK